MSHSVLFGSPEQKGTEQQRPTAPKQLRPLTVHLRTIEIGKKVFLNRQKLPDKEANDSSANRVVVRVSLRSYRFIVTARRVFGQKTLLVFCLRAQKTSRISFRHDHVFQGLRSREICPRIWPTTNGLGFKVRSECMRNSPWKNSIVQVAARDIDFVPNSLGKVFCFTNCSGRFPYIAAHRLVLINQSRFRIQGLAGAVAHVSFHRYTE